MNKVEYSRMILKEKAEKLLTIERPEEELERMLRQLTEGLNLEETDWLYSEETDLPNSEEFGNFILACRGAYVVGKARDVVKFIGERGTLTRHDVAMLAPKMLAGSNLELPEDYWERRELTDRMIEQGLRHDYVQEGERGLLLSPDGIQNVITMMKGEVWNS